MSGGSEEQPHDPGQVRGFHYWRRPGRSAANSHRRGRLLAEPGTPAGSQSSISASTRSSARPSLRCASASCVRRPWPQLRLHSPLGASRFVPPCIRHRPFAISWALQGWSPTPACALQRARRQSGRGQPQRHREEEKRPRQDVVVEQGAVAFHACDLQKSHRIPGRASG